MNAEMIAKLKELANKQTFADRVVSEVYHGIDMDADLEPHIDEYFGGSASDAYLAGEFDGHIELARELLRDLKIAF